MPNILKVSEIKQKLLRPALTSKFEVELGLPSGVESPKFRNTDVQKKLNISCCDAVLPGSSLATYDINNDRHGVTERHAYRRVHDDRLDLVFYVDGENYDVIQFFENWIGYIVGQAPIGESSSNLSRSNYFHRSRYFSEYVTQALRITKFESDHGHLGNFSTSVLRYNFVNAYPFSIMSMPISYESSALLKCTVGFRYVRYYIGDPENESKPESATTEPEENRPKGNPSPKDGSAAATKFFDDNKNELINDKSGTDFNFDPSKFGGGGKIVTPNLNSDIA